MGKPNWRKNDAKRREEHFKFGKGKNETIEPSITIHCFDHHPRFPDALAAITVVSLNRRQERTEHLILIAKRTVPFALHSQHSVAGELKHLHSDALGGSNGLYEAHVYKPNYHETQISDNHNKCGTVNEAITKMRLILATRRVGFEHAEVESLVKRLGLNLH